MCESIQSVVIELRPRIGTAVIFIRFNPQIDCTKVNVQLETEAIVLHDHTSPPYRLETPNVTLGNVSNYVAKDNAIHFRAQIKTSSTDWVVVPHRSGNSYINLANVKPPLLHADVTYIPECRGCTCKLANSVKFRKVLPVWEETSLDFFCHDHGNKLDISTESSEDDCRYGLCSWLAHVSKFDRKGIAKGQNSVACNRCKKKLGTFTSDDQYKFWNSTVQWNPESKAMSSQDDFLLHVEDAMRKSVGIVTKVCVETEGSAEKSYLLLWILERELPLLYYCNTSSAKSSLLDKTVVKVLYLLQTDRNNLIRSWQDVDCVMKVSLLEDIFVSGVQLLIKNAAFIPKALKMSNGFFVSYLPVL